MANILGSIQVELSANTAKFVDGLSKAAYTAQQSAKSISREFSSLQRVASQTFGAFGGLNPIISQVSYGLSTMSRAASEAMASLGKTTSALGAVSAIGAGAGAALAVAGVGMLGMAARAAEAAAKLGVLSQSTGVSVEALSALAYAAKEGDVPLETMAVGLERLSKSAFAAATAPAGAVNAYTRLGISVRDASGALLPAQTIFQEIADKFADMPDGVTKTALAIEFFGRGGAALIPVMNQGGGAIKGMTDSAQKLGAVLDTNTSRAAEEFHRSLIGIDQIGDGISNTLLRDLLPALTSAADGIVSWAERNQEAIRKVVWVFAELGEAVLEIGATIHSVLAQGITAVWDGLKELAEGFEAIWEGTADAMTGNFSGAAAAIKSHFADLENTGRDFLDHSKQIWGDYGHFMKETVSSVHAGGPMADKRGGPVDTSAKGTAVSGTEKDTVADLIQKLTAEAHAEDALASATDRSTAAVLLQKAAGEAATKISEVRTGLLDEETKLTEQLANARAEHRAPEAANLEKQIGDVKQYLAELDTDTPLIESLYARFAAPKFAESSADEIQKFIEKTRESIADAQAMAAAYAQGPLAVADVQEHAKIAPFEEELKALDQLRDKGAITAAEYGVVASQIQKAIAAVQQLSEAESHTAANKIEADINLQIAALSRLTAAAFGSAAALRSAQVENRVQELIAANPHASPTDIDNVRGGYSAQSAAEHGNELATRAAQLDPTVDYQREIEQLKEIGEAYSSNKNIVLAVNAAIYDANRKSIEQFDQMADKAGSIGDRFRELANQIELSGQDFTGKIFDSMSKMVDDISGQLAKLVVTGKANFKELFEGMAEQMVKASFQSSFAHLINAISPPAKAQPAAAAAGAATGGLPFTSPFYFGDGPGGTAGTFAGPLGLGGGASGSGVAAGAPTGVLAGISGAVGKMFGIKPPGAAKAMRGDSAGNPLYVSVVGAGGFGTSGTFAGTLGTSAGGPSASGGITGSLAKMFKAMSLSKTDSNSDNVSFLNPFGIPGTPLPPPPPGAGGGLAGELGSTASGIGGLLSKLIPGTAGGIFGSIAKIFGSFGGFMASGGDVTPGKAYVVGENHPEFFVPSSPGTIHPTLKTDSGPHQTVVNMHIHGATDADSFRRSQTQIYAGMHAQLGMARARNG